MTLLHLNSLKEYNDFTKSNNLCIIVFTATGVLQSKQMVEVIEEMSLTKEFGSAKFACVMAEDVPEISLKADITAVPVVLIIKNGIATDRVNGFQPAAVTEKVKKYLETMGSCQKEPLEARLKKLVNKAPCMLFMKGNPKNPRCGFSRTIVSILDGYKTDYQTFDILEDQEVREGLKKFSNWPTYPQLYLNGELVGGLDIVREMSEGGELESTLPKKSD